MSEKEITGFWDVIEALEGVFASASTAARETLARTLDAYSDDFPEDFCWAIGEQSPTMLNKLLTTIMDECSSDRKPKPRLRLVDCETKGSA